MELTNVLIGCICALAALLLSAIAALRNKKKDDEAEGAKDGVMMTVIGYIKAGIDDIKTIQREQGRTIEDLSGRMVRVEESTKSAHKRIDAIEDKV